MISLTPIQKQMLDAAQILPTSEALRRLNILCHLASMELWSARIQKTEASGLTAADVAAADYFSSWQGFHAAKVPFDEWQEVARAAIDFLQKFIPSGAEKYEDSVGFAEFWDLRQETMKRLENDPRYRDGFRDLQGR